MTTPAPASAPDVTIALEPEHCSICKVEIDLTGKDRSRRPGLVEDGGVMCATCTYEAEREYVVPTF